MTGMGLRSEVRYAWYGYRQLAVGVVVGAVVAAGAVHAFERGYDAPNPAPAVASSVTRPPAPAAQDDSVGQLSTTPSTPSQAPTPAPAPAPAPAKSVASTVTVTGEAILLQSHWEEAIDDAACYESSITFVAVNGRQETAALAAFQDVTPVDVERKDGNISWACHYPYTMILPTDTPVYSFKASVEGVEMVDPWSDTVNTSALPGDAPRPLLSWCSACVYSRF